MLVCTTLATFQWSFQHQLLLHRYPAMHSECVWHTQRLYTFAICCCCGTWAAVTSSNDILYCNSTCNILSDGDMLHVQCCRDVHQACSCMMSVTSSSWLVGDSFVEQSRYSVHSCDLVAADVHQAKHLTRSWHDKHAGVGAAVVSVLNLVLPQNHKGLRLLAMQETVIDRTSSQQFICHVACLETSYGML